MATLDPAKNFAVANVLTGYAAGTTTIVLQSGQGAVLSDPSTEGAFNLIYWNATDYANPSDDPSHEIIRCTARSTDTLTVTRAQESTSDVAHNTVGKQYKVAMAWTKKMRDDVETYVNKQWKYLETITYTAESGIKTTSTFTTPTTAFQYKIIFNVENNYSGNNILGLNVNGISTSVYGWGNISLTAFPAVGGQSTGQGSCGIAYFTASGQSVSGEISVNAQKDTGNFITFSGRCGSNSATLGVLTGGYGNIGSSFTSVENISIVVGQNITGTFKIYRLEI